MERTDIIVIGGGIIGLATADAILRSRPNLSVAVLEKEARAASHQSGRNSGVIHSGIYYRPDSLKARTVAAGRSALLELCRSEGIPYQITGKVIVATDEAERPALMELQSRAGQHGIPVSFIGADRLADIEPSAVGVAALHVPSAGIVDFKQVCETLLRLVRSQGGEFRARTRVLGLRESDSLVVAETAEGPLGARVAINCAGLHSDHLARMRGSGRTAALQIVPFRGEYRRLVGRGVDLVRSMIYPVPDPRFPFLGVHFTRTIDGDVHVGPNAVLALGREGYSWKSIDFTDMWDLLRFPGFRRLVQRHWRMGLREMRQSVSQRAFLSALQRLVPDVRADHLAPADAGVRAQAVDANGALVDDFVIRESRRMIHVLNAPSPAATASLEIGRVVASRVAARL